MSNFRPHVEGLLTPVRGSVCVRRGGESYRIFARVVIRAGEGDVEPTGEGADARLPGGSRASVEEFHLKLDVSEHLDVVHRALVEIETRERARCGHQL